MKIWLLDYKSTNERRNWSEMIGTSFGELRFDESGHLDDIKRLGENEIIVCHGFDWLPEPQNEVEKLSKKFEENKIWVIGVSASGGSMMQFGQSFYYRRKSVESKIGHIDHSFRECFHKFKTDLEKQLASGGSITPNFSLLEPPSAPEALLSLYLCDVASMDLDTQQEAEMLNRAELEFNALVDREQLQPSDIQLWGEILKDRATGIGSLLKKLELKD